MAKSTTDYYNHTLHTYILLQSLARACTHVYVPYMNATSRRYRWHFI